DTFFDTAAIIKNLDLVVTCDTAVAHLAGALGVPVWVALPVGADWRWLLGREDSPWYPTMRLFRQKEAGNWQEGFQRIGDELAKEIATGRTMAVPQTDIVVDSGAKTEPPPTTLAMFPSFNRVKRCRHGLMLYNIYDRFVGKSLEVYGEYSEGEVDLL